MRFPLRGFAVTATLILVAAATVAAQDLQSAKQAYAAAAYDEALGTLERLEAAGTPAPPDARAIHEYRALCLLALGRQAEAVSRLESVILADPTFRLDAAIASPRVLSLVTEVRRKAVPAAARKRYLDGKAALERKDYAKAQLDLDTAVGWLEAPDLVAAQDASVNDLRTLILGFYDLAKASAPATPPPPPKPAAPPEPRYYQLEDAGVQGPVTVQQRIPAWPAQMPKPVGAAAKGMMEVLVSETGSVESARIIRPTQRFFDDRLLEEARKWQFKPATKDGAPVKFRKIITVTIG